MVCVFPLLHPKQNGWIVLHLDNIGLPKYPSLMEKLLALDDPNISCYTWGMVSMLKLGISKLKFWEQEGPRKLLTDTVKRLSVNEKVYQHVPINSDGRALHSFQQKLLQRTTLGQVEWSLVDYAEINAHFLFKEWNSSRHSLKEV